MATVYKYRLWCNTENQYFEVWGTETPTKCPNEKAGDPTHSISNITVIDEVSSHDVKIVADTTKRLDTEGNSAVTIQPRIATGTTIVSHNFGDPCTWYQGSIEIVNEVLTPKTSGSFYTYKMSKEYIIDIEHGRITFDEKVDPKYKVKIFVNGVQQTSGFSINYEDGEVTFQNSLTASDEVKASYWYANESTFTLAPLPGKKLKVENVESQFTEDVKLNGTSEIWFEEWGYDPNNLPNKMMYRRIKYKNIAQFIDESNNRYSAEIKPIDNITKPMHIFVWNYPAARVMEYTKGAEVRIRVYDLASNSFNKPLKNTGNTRLERATVTFYCISENV